MPQACKECEYCQIIEGKTLTELFYFFCTLADRDMHSLFDWEHSVPYWCPLNKLISQQ